MPPSRPLATQRDVAQAAGVSVMTVSLALRNRPGVAAATAAKIREAAAQLGYRPDPALSALVHYRNRRSPRRIKAAIALCTTWESRDGWLKTSVGQLAYEGARRRAEEFGYRLEHFWLGRNGEYSRRVGDILASRGIRGILLPPVVGAWADLQIDWSRFCVVTLERFPDFPPVPHVSPNHYADLMLAWERLTALGYRRIGLAVFQWLSHRGQFRWEAAQLIKQREVRTRDRIPSLVVDAVGRVPTAEVDRWMRRHAPDAVISPSPEFHEALRAGGWRIPRDVGYASLQIQLEQVPVAGINQHRDLMGAACIDLLQGRLLRSEYGIPTHLSGTTLHGEWVDGPTAPPRGGS